MGRKIIFKRGYFLFDKSAEMGYFRAAMKTIQVQRSTTRDRNNVLCSTVHLVINGQLCKPTKPLGFVWGPRTWSNGMTYLSRKEFVFEVQGQAFRMGSKSAKPLKLAADEVLHPMGFSGNDSNAFVLPVINPAQP